ncbi:MAG: type III pantothenate kinase [Candidatus Nitrotoga sp.]|nr:type III pantothenate kinase [Candidatus Nitrotoga sp.]MDW7604618.1 type III pantothenate kinase [Candidatus Nitrotoga sp.]MDW7612695.1 type III pantothenate kinase [Candidatus Nitrotoga sp.]MDW7625134.1 type III pantothenate kinase [Candidatus Nitrotoga sp.]
MRILLIDAGNSRVKWAMVEGETWLREGTLLHRDMPTLGAEFSGLPSPDRILVSNVAGDVMAQLLGAACAIWRCQVEFIVARVAECGVRNLYECPAQLGCDRWATLIAAWDRVRAPCLVVNCGTATTIDTLSLTGEFLGGLILPGLSMLEASLTAGAAQLGQIEGGAWYRFPRNTADAILSGAIQATVGAVRLQFEAMAQAGDCHCVLSGGGADSLQSYLELPVIRVDNLVLRGLQIIGSQKID